jgi:alanyl-tRNA synthetase
MTHRLYYYDATQRTISATVTARGQIADSEGEIRPAIRLDRTAFYPTSGGQPHDTGVLAGTPVLEVLEDEEGEIWHLLATPLPEDLREVVGRINWDRRFDHMQQHSGQHLLSAVFEDAGSSILGADGHTIGFHLGTASSTIDLDLPDLTWDEAFRVELAVNRLIWQNHPFDVSIVSSDRAAALDLRKPPPVTESVRVVSVAGIDASACGGTHVRATGEIGLLKITGIAHYKGGIRVDFLCGERALRAYQQTLQTLQSAGAMLSVGLDVVPEAIGRAQDEAKACHRASQRLLDDLLDYEADKLWSATSPDGGRRAIRELWADRDFDEVRGLALRLRERPFTVALLGATDAGSGNAGALRLICARSDDLPDLDANAILRAALTTLGGRGGGQPTLAQGGAPLQPTKVIMDALEAALLQSR